MPLNELYPLPEEFEAVLQPTSEAPINEHEIDLLFMKFDDKLESCLAALKNMKANLTMISEEIDRLEGMEHALENRIKNLSEYIMGEMISHEIEKVDYGMHRAFVARAPVSAEVNMNLLPEEWHKEVKPPDPEPNKKAIITHYKETGEELPGVTYNRKRYLRITK